MAFTLEVEFSGLCQYLVQEDLREVGILLPDGRQNGRPVQPPDFEKFDKYLVHHVGYLRYDLADVAPTGVVTSRSGRGGTPSSEVIYRFDKDHLEFGLQSNGPMLPKKLDMPDRSKFAPNVRNKRGLFSDSPPKDLLMRTILRGGTLSSRPLGGWSQFNQALQNDGDEIYAGQFAGSANWSCDVPDDKLVLRIRDWEGNVKNVIQLNPREPDGVIRLKIANLCAENPMEWPELFLRAVTNEPDNDFKWFYFLWEDGGGDPFEDLMKRKNPHLLPVPVPIPSHGELSNCTGVQSAVAKVRGA